MGEDNKEPQTVRPPEPNSPSDSAKQPVDSGTPPPSAIPNPGEVSGADAEKAAMVEQAKTRVAAVKESLEATPPTGAPKPPVKKKEEGPKPSDASQLPLVKDLKERFGEVIEEATEFLDQLSVRVRAGNIAEVCEYLRQREGTPFNYLSDITCVHFPTHQEAPLEVVYNLYSISANQRVRLKIRTNEDDAVPSVTSVWPAANWLEREVFDLFGVSFHNHPDLRRILLPPDWEGHPFRKDYPLEFVENQWTAKHLPEMTTVQREQLEQRRAYGLEILSVPEERMMREIFQQGKEVMPKDK
jgi:NADH-quinone oxidoreductase subunit C